MLRNAAAAMRCTPIVAAMNTARPEMRDDLARRLLSANGEIREVAAVDRGVGHVVEDLDGHGLGYECK